ncbi:DUF3093 domain-containing protein [Leucobacter sp. Marseille-Q4368]|uniref:DUF3093 domain-containing protein n=2 Tax=Microbacteriaceae TaxID=85023 RepID=A0ABS5M3H1_9MICO|nr:DUF3093 domain-containing protein [Leucobacter manosquensis]
MEGMTRDPSTVTPTTTYRERLLPGVSLFIALVLVIPAVALVLTPINAQWAIPTGVAVYVILAVTFLLLSPSITVENGRLVAGRAEIPVALLGDIELLGAERLKAAIGPGSDARNYLLLRGWIHRGVRIANVDPADPAPHWILTSRHPQKLADAITAARAE